MAVMRLARAYLLALLIERLYEAVERVRVGVRGGRGGCWDS